MSAFIQLELDTTSPELESISMPTYVGYGDNTEIELVFSETLAPNHIIEVIDNDGNVKELTFEVIDNTIHGLLDVSGLLGGMAELRITVFDSVLNPSQIISENFIIITVGILVTSEISTHGTEIINNISKTEMISIGSETEIDFIGSKSEIVWEGSKSVMSILN